MSTPKTVTVRVTHRFTASPERVFDAWLDPARASKFLFATEAGQMVKVEIDPRVGGAYALVDRRDGEDVAHVGEYLEIDRPRRLVFTFGVPKYSPLMTTVTIDIVPLEDGCDLTLTNEGVLPEYEQPSISGWTQILEGLAASV
jgi:uncharacterized protein YndB with AHSA1/START domain